MDSLINQLTTLQEQVRTLIQQLQIDEKSATVTELEQRASDPNFWDSPDEAQALMQKLSRLKTEVERWQNFAQRVDDALELAQLGDDMLDEIQAETSALAKLADKMSIQAMLSGDYDGEDAILAIHAGAGGVDAQDWAEMLERMYLRWMEQAGYKAEIIDRSWGDEAGIKSVTINVKGDYAYGYLKSEQGVHRLVRISPFDANARRHTSFAKVELWPDIAQEIEIDIPEKDIRVDVFRSSGPGGQSVNTTDSAVRITHLPTGLVVECQEERSQHKNRARAMALLQARLTDTARRTQAAERAATRRNLVGSGDRSERIRTYNFSQGRVTDHRIDLTLYALDAILEGQLDAVIEPLRQEHQADLLASLGD